MTKLLSTIVFLSIASLSLGVIGTNQAFAGNFEGDTCASCQKAFDAIKHLLASSPALTTPDFMKQFILKVDASDVAVGSVLLQEDDEKLEHPIGYFSRSSTFTRKTTLLLKRSVCLYS